MAYKDLVIKNLKQTSPTTIYEFQRIHSLCVNRILTATRLCRCMSALEAAAWDKVSLPGSKRMSSNLSGLLNPILMETMRASESEYKPVILKWFSFDHPYLFKKYNVNEADMREGQEYLMVLPIGFEVKAALIKRLLPDVSMKGISQQIRADACRGKVEGGTVTLGIPLSLLERISSQLSIERLGHRILL
ncbi:hypothetical protein [Cedecea sp.]|jgi:hypothetical protein|uniref:hypothetical protein n=1 Tax=Cedecea sp. TaxID=1970739 RepID=UPI002F3EE226